MYLINNLVKEMCMIYARLINQYKFKYQCTFLAFDKQDEDDNIRRNRIIYKFKY